MAVLLAGSASPSHAQDIEGAPTTPSYSRGFNVAVRERAHPEWAPLALRIGAFTVEPQLLVTTLYTDNEKDVPAGAQSDFITAVEPAIAVTSDWSRHLIAGEAWFARDQNADVTTDSASEYGADLTGRLDIFRALTLTSRLEADHLADPSSDPDAPPDRARRAMYDKERAQVSLTDDLARGRVRAVLNYQDLGYEDVLTTGGATTSQAVRDSRYVSLAGEATYAISPEIAVFASALLDDTARPSAAGFDQGSNGYTLGGGVNFDVGHLARGEVRLGYYRERYDAGGVKPDAGLDVKLDLQYFPTQLTTLSVRVARSALTEDIFTASGVAPDANAAGSPGGAAVSGGVTIDHELLRNLILSAHVAPGAADYAGIDRHDRSAVAGLGARYLMNRRVRLELNYAYRDFRSSGADARRAYDEDRVWLTTRLAY